MLLLESQGIVDSSWAMLIGLPLIGLVASIYYAYETSKVVIDPSKDESLQSRTSPELVEIVQTIQAGARSFLFREYLYMAIFIVLFSVIIGLFLGFAKDTNSGVFTALSFIFGAVTSIVSGFIGMEIATYANGRTAVRSADGLNSGFNTAFKAGSVMGFSLVSLGVLVLLVLIKVIESQFEITGDKASHAFEIIAGYGLGGSSIAMFGRVGGGIYTKAADVGADLVGKVEANIPEDDPRNPAVIADNVGDNVGDIAGMGADLFGSFAEATCAAMVISASSPSLNTSIAFLTFPILISAFGIFACVLTSFVAIHTRVDYEKQVEQILKMQLLISTVLMTGVLALVTYLWLPSGDISFPDFHEKVTWWKVYICILLGLWSGLIIGYITEYYTSNTYAPVQDVASSCTSGAATNIIYGLALGYRSVIIPVFCLSITIYGSYGLAGMYGIAMGALGILSTLSIGLAIDAYGPIADNAGGIAEMSHMDPSVRDTTDVLDAAGNTTAAIGKGFAIGSAALVSLALFGAFVSSDDTDSFSSPSDPSKTKSVNLLGDIEFAGLLFGAMIPYWFSALTMKSVGKAALAMVEEVRAQFRDNPGILQGETKPNYARCIQVSTDASLREMIAPGALVMLTPILVGLLLGKRCLAGLLAGSLVSGVQIAISMSNTGSAWDNAKKYIEKGRLDGHAKGSEAHKAAVIGDTVGDPLKDTSGPATNIVLKLMAIISLVFGPAFPKTGYLIQLFQK